MKTILRAALGVLALLFGAHGAFAQQSSGSAQVYTSCGSAAYTAGRFAVLTEDITGKLCTSASGGGGGGGAVFGPTAVGSPAANPPVLTGGTANALATGTVQVNKVDSGGDQFVNLAEINGVAPSITNPIWIANAEAADSTGTFTNATQTTSVTNTNADGYATALLSINGTYGTASGVFEESDDTGSTYYGIICTRSDGTASETGYTSLTNTNRQWSCPVAGNDSVRIRSTAVASGTVNARVGISAPTNNSGVVSGSVVVTQPTAANLNATVVGTGTFAVQNTAATPAGTNLIGAVSPQAAATGGMSVFSKQVANNTTSVAADASAGTLYGVTVWNNSGVIAYLKLYNTAQGSVTCGSGTPVQRILIPANTSGTGAVVQYPLGIAYGTAITGCVTTGYADADATAPAASAYIWEVNYK